jgi:hypothetical protein
VAETSGRAARTSLAQQVGGVGGPRVWGEQLRVSCMG